ncbi:MULTISPECIES: hypothetical protein [Streptacidiphilus]|uniref:Uncharacterized protein n=2 Tax=Streptacidiphilus TaxID=228398 RepID=A0ABV6ULX3_9ACTN|nr:hypothetical protein [Streptacidiphilus jeojiense]
MTDDSAATAAAEPPESHPQPQAEPPRTGRARLVFEDPLSRPSRDDTDTGWGGEESGGRDEAWYRRETPPHHGD